MDNYADLLAYIAKNGRKLDNDRFHSVEKVSQGAQGIVFSATEKLQKSEQTGGETERPVALKFVPMNDRNMKNLKAELLNHRKLRHPHVVLFSKVFRLLGYACIVMEYVSGGRLLDLLLDPKRGPHMEEGQARYYFQQLAIAVDYCHRRGVVVRDLKLDNALVEKQGKDDDEGRPLYLIKICDFGLSKAPSGQVSHPKTACGTVSYAAPEVITCRPGQWYDGNAVDVWSLGVMLYTMLYGRFPFAPAANQVAAAQNYEVTQRILNDKLELPPLPGVAADEDTDDATSCKHLLRQLLEKDPKKRITMQGVMDHPWFRTGLPDHVLKMYEEWLKWDPDSHGVQSEQDILKLLEA